MASYNRIVLMGNLTRDPQLSYTPANMAVCKFGIATNRRWRDRDGNMQDEVCYVDCTAFGQRAETFNRYMSKGRGVLVEGRLQFQQWTAQDGQKRSKHEVVVDNFTFLGRGADEAGAPGAQADVGGAPVRTGGAPAEPETTGAGYDEPPPPTDDGIPF